MKISFIYYLLIISNYAIYAQNEVIIDSISKSNPIIFPEIYFGIGSLENNYGWIVGGNLNYQFYKTDLITARVNFNSGPKASNTLLLSSGLYPLSEYGEIQEEQIEGALLYGKRWINRGVSFSISGGVSYVYRQYPKEQSNYFIKDTQEFIGFPIELNVKFFKKEKRPFRAYYGIIPTGKRKVSFGRAVGFKIIGNFGKSDYLAFGMTYGLGWHKKY